MRMLFATVLAFVATGCTSDETRSSDVEGNADVQVSTDSAGAEVTPVPIDELSQAVAEATCARHAICEPIIVGTNAGNKPACIDLWTARLNAGVLEIILSDVESGKITYNPDKAAECLNKMSKGECWYRVTGDILDSCDGVFEGTLNENEPCTLDEQCNNGRCDIGPNPSMSGLCTGACTAYKEAGATCSEGFECSKGLRCVEETCQTADGGKEGSPCGAESSCRGSLVCVLDGEGQSTGTCQAKLNLFSLEEGAACAIQSYQAIAAYIYQGNPISSDVAVCKKGLHCAVESMDMTTGSQTAFCRKPSASGESCHYAQPHFQCPTNHFCDAHPQKGVLTATCIELPSEGEECNQGDGPKCSFGLDCSSNSVCVKPKANDESCSSNSDCISDYCEAETTTCKGQPECHDASSFPPPGIP